MKKDISSVVYSVVVPVYKNDESLPELVNQLSILSSSLDAPMEAVFVIDDSPDNSLLTLRRLLPSQEFRSRLIVLSRNFGSFAAIKTGFGLSQGKYIGAISADLQEPPELVLDFFRILSTSEFDVVIGKRESRQDPTPTRLLSSMYWGFYRKFIQNQIPEGGVDVFATSREVANQLTQLNESNSSLVGLLMWVGYRRTEVPYQRLQRVHGKSAWTFRKKLKYLTDSVFSFTSLPISLILVIGMFGLISTSIISIAVFLTWLFGGIAVPGYAAQMLVQLLTSGSILFAIGILGTYMWRTYENSKQRPTAIVRLDEIF